MLQLQLSNQADRTSAEAAGHADTVTTQPSPAHDQLQDAPASSAMLSEQPMRQSLQVAPLAINKSRAGSVSDASSASDHTASTNTIYSAVSQYTPPTTPNDSHDDLDSTTSSQTPVFHNFLRAFYPFHPTYAMTDSTITLPLNQGDVVLVHSIHTNGWADGTLLVSGARGWLPTNYCEAYDPEEMKNLLNALLMFWDLLRSTSVNDNEVFGNQEFMKGIIAGVRSLLERTHCLTRESANVQRSDGLRRGRKSLLSELSSLVKAAKRLQESQRGLLVVQDDVNDIVDEMILKAFKIVVKGVRFLDVLDEDRRVRAPAASIMAEHNLIPPTPPAESTSFTKDQDHNQGHNPEEDHNRVADAASRVAAGETTQAMHEATYHPPELAQTTGQQLTRRASSLLSPASSNSYRLSQGHPVATNRLSTTLSHRMSLAGPSPLSSPQKLVSERLGSSHDTFLSHLASLIGRLHLQSQSRPDLALAIKQSATSGGDLLAVIDAVCSRMSLAHDNLDLSRTAMYDRIHELVSAAKDILTSAGAELDIIMPQDNGRLLLAATDCVKAAGECVQKTKWVIEKIGDFEFENGNGSLGIDLSALDVFPEEPPLSAGIHARTGNESPESPRSLETTDEPVPELEAEPEREAGRSPTMSSNAATTPRPTYCIMDKPLPEVPQSAAPIIEESQPSYSPPSSRPASLAEDAASSMHSSVSSIRPTLPPLPKLTTSLMPQVVYSPTEASAVTEGESPILSRTGAPTASSASSSGTASTYISRDSEASFPSRTSTRATTPELASQTSMAELNSTSTTVVNDEEEVESKLLAQTYANELMFNKEGQVTGGSLSALVERLTTHESTPDAMFVSTFYLTFRLFCTPAKLAEALIDRFDYVETSNDMASPVRLRVYNVFKGWMESHWRDGTDHEVLKTIQSFAEFKLSAVLPSAGARLLALAERVSVTGGSIVPRLVSSMGKTNTVSQYIPVDTPLPNPIITKSQMNALNTWKLGNSSPTILDFDPLEIARQLTLKQMSIFCSIIPEELLGSQWMKNGGVGSPNVKAMTALSTDLSNLVAETILQYNEVKKRASVIKQWIKVAHQCLELNNYDCLMAIICSLNSSTITRLRKTWDFVSPKRREMLRTLQGIVEPANNNRVLRGRLHDHVPPCLPFLGMFLTDLTFVDIGNPPTKQLSNGGTEEQGLTVVNFDKHTRTAKIIGELQRFQIPYRLTEVPELQGWLGGQVQRMRESEDTNVQVTYYRQSLLLEPRESTVRAQQDGQSTNGQKDYFGWISRDRSNTHGAQGAAV